MSPMVSPRGVPVPEFMIIFNLYLYFSHSLYCMETRTKDIHIPLYIATHWLGWGVVYICLVNNRYFYSFTNKLYLGVFDFMLMKPSHFETFTIFLQIQINTFLVYILLFILEANLGKFPILLKF